MRRAAVLVLLTTFAACREETVAALPPPAPLTAQSVGHFCQMNLLEHPGPKAQVWLQDVSAPLFFSQVRDAIAYARLPEQSHPILGTYVSDMGRAPSWEDPGESNWISAGEAFYVVGSTREGGMGAPETVPFSAEAEARAFAAAFGGSVMRLPDIPDAAVLAPAGPDTRAGGDDPDYAARLRTLATEPKP